MSDYPGKPKLGTLQNVDIDFILSHAEHHIYEYRGKIIERSLLPVSELDENIRQKEIEFYRDRIEVWLRIDEQLRQFKYID
jgi:hypothetical protein